MTKSIAELQAEAAEYKPQIRDIKAVIVMVHRKELVPANKTNVARVLASRGYIVWMPRARRYKLTEEGTRFYKGVKKFGHLA